MKLFYIPLFLTLFFIASCNKSPDNKLKNEQSCNNLPDGFASNKIANGCEDFSKNILGANSTVFIAVGGGICTGTVVSPHFIITAAHCTVKAMPSDTEIILGQNTFDVFNVKSLKVKNIYSNNIYGILSKASLGDIALIQTEDNLVDNSLTPAKVILSKPIPFEKILSIGYGLEGEYKKGTIGIKRWALSSVGSLKINMSLYDKNNLETLYTDFSNSNFVSKKYDSNYTQDTFLVTSKKSQSEGQTCNGDSGGPQFVIRNGEAVLISATQGLNAIWQGDEVIDVLNNRKDSCEYENGLNTRIAPYVDWVNTIMKKSGESLVLIDK
ncbi:trypsin-like serine protease [Silvanigrella paludirubra]|uniref:Trypsin-like serine protease n=1 Tax=Silvanigrella paludirubra TaxID=2499159 RepID=A0A6N6VZV7_9BACT|nr:trypsin-like serine protease [Silvanigrella paludirubra]KAB8040916.1 trypsin-like serine protease [Silvanigrella paludirubra]